MPPLRDMPALNIDQTELAAFGAVWQTNGGNLSRTPPYNSPQLCQLFDRSVGAALAAMLGDIPIVVPKGTALIPPEKDCVEVGPVRVIGGVRSQNFDVGYRPDGLRFAFDSKSLNEKKSIGKNYQNMINDLATEATTVHSRFPYAVVGFGVIVPEPCLGMTQLAGLLQTLERLGQRDGVNDPLYFAEAIFLAVWNPVDGSISNTIPDISSPIRIDWFSDRVARAYATRYKGLPPHV